MGPVKSKRPTARVRVSHRSDPRGRYAPPSPSDDISADPADIPIEDAGDDAFGFGESFKLNKKDKRVIKHSNLMHKVREAGISKEKKLKRRRPARKLKADIGGLADALPDVEDEEEDWEEADDDENGDMAMDAPDGAKLRKSRRRKAAPVGEGTTTMKMNSLRHRPGAMKRKRKMESTEMERFGKNLAQLIGHQTKTTATEASQGTSADRWAALRSFIGGTLEKDKAFAKT